MWKCAFTIFAATVCVANGIFLLPNSVKPLRYGITIEPNLTFVDHPSTFWGDVTIQLAVQKDTDSIILHAVELDIDNSTIKVVGPNGEVPVETADSYHPDEIYIIKLKQNLIKDHLYNLTIGKYSGSMQTNSRGIYKAYYVSNETRKSVFSLLSRPSDVSYRFVAVTHFEPTFARYAFPCFDEPHQKARFTISLIRDKDHNSVSNEDLDRTEQLDDNRFKDTFKETPLMPTYTVAFAVSDFKCTKRVGKNRIYANPRAIPGAELERSLNYSIEILNEFEDYFGINFTLSKIDSFAVPAGYFKHFAMENWGLITYGENHIFCGSNCKFNRLKKLISYISHEFAHQWFGNLVTHKSWDYIWLSESFAAYFQFFMTSKVQPSWKIMEFFPVEVVQDSFQQEERNGAHALNFKITRYGQFPPFHIMYQKGSSIVRMISHFLTPDLFRKALHNYLLDRQFQNVVPADLYSSLQQTVDAENASHLLGGNSISDILGSWDSFEGYPNIIVRRNYETGEVVVTQSSALSPNQHLLKVPINYVSSHEKMNFEDTKVDFWLTRENGTLNLSTEGWLIFNKQLTGYYRVNYDLENWDRIIKALNSDDFKKIHVVNRAQLINDAFYFAYHDQLPIDVPFRLAEYLVREKDYVAFSAFYTSLQNYCKIYNGNPSKNESEYFLNHTLRNSVTEETNGYKEEYMVFRLYIRNVMNYLRQYLADKRSSNSLSLFDELNQNDIYRYFYGFFNE